jgi:hypothetical protein
MDWYFTGNTLGAAQVANIADISGSRTEFGIAVFFRAKWRTTLFVTPGSLPRKGTNDGTTTTATAPAPLTETQTISRVDFLLCERYKRYNRDNR